MNNDKIQNLRNEIKVLISEQNKNNSRNNEINSKIRNINKLIKKEGDISERYKVNRHFKIIKNDKEIFSTDSIVSLNNIFIEYEFLKSDIDPELCREYGSESILKDKLKLIDLIEYLELHDCGDYCGL